MNPLTAGEAKAILRIARELLAIDAPDSVFVSHQRYFAEMDREPVSDFFMRIKKLPSDVRPLVAESLSTGQVDSKLWLIEKLSLLRLPVDAKVYVLGGWFGILGLLINWMSEGRSVRVRSIDLEAKCTQVAVDINRWHWHDDYRFLSIESDMMDLDYEHIQARPYQTDFQLNETPDIIINTSCEHLPRFSEWWAKIPKGMKVVLQSNNFFAHKEHVNCVESLDAFKLACGFSKLVFGDTLKLTNYDRFMLIGER